MISYAFTTYKLSSPLTWEYDILVKMPANELIALCELLGIAISGTRTQIAERLLALGALRVKLSTYPEGREGAEILVQDYKGKELQQMARLAGCWLAPQKIGLAIGLINWRTKCRRSGQEALEHAKAAPIMKSTPRQLSMILEMTAD